MVNLARERPHRRRLCFMDGSRSFADAPLVVLARLTPSAICSKHARKVGFRKEKDCQRSVTRRAQRARSWRCLFPHAAGHARRGCASRSGYHRRRPSIVAVVTNRRGFDRREGLGDIPCWPSFAVVTALDETAVNNRVIHAADCRRHRTATCCYTVARWNGASGSAARAGFCRSCPQAASLLAPLFACASAGASSDGRPALWRLCANAVPQVLFVAATLCSRTRGGFLSSNSAALAWAAGVSIVVPHAVTRPAVRGTRAAAEPAGRLRHER